MRRKVVLKDDRYLILQHAAGRWQVVLYRKREKGEVGHEPGISVWPALARASMVPMVPRLDYCRFATQSRRLDIAIKDTLAKAGCLQLTGEVLDYLECIEWGREALNYVV